VKPNAGTQHKVQGHNDVCTCDQECDKWNFLHALVLWWGYRNKSHVLTPSTSLWSWYTCYSYTLPHIPLAIVQRNASSDNHIRTLTSNKCFGQGAMPERVVVCAWRLPQRTLMLILKPQKAFPWVVGLTHMPTMFAFTNSSFKMLGVPQHIDQTSRASSTGHLEQKTSTILQVDLTP
jgi:hypothetical protein